MNLRQSLRLNHPACVAFVGAGGKTTAIFRLAREIAAPVVVTTTTHFGTWQPPAGDRWVMKLDALEAEIDAGAAVVVVTGTEMRDCRVGGLRIEEMDRLGRLARERGWSMLVEADGSRQLPLKSPDAHEPQIPVEVEMVVVVAGLSGLGKPCNNAYIHRPMIFSSLTGLALDEPVGEESLCRALLHPLGGLKGIPADARRVVLLNQADDEGLISAGIRMAAILRSGYDAVLIGCMRNSPDSEIVFLA